MEHVMITGANRGIGLEFVRQYHARGAQVYATCRTPDTADSLHTFTERVTVVALDVTDPDSIDAAYNEIKQHTVRLDVLISNAGYLYPEYKLDDVDPVVAAHTFAINATGPFLVGRRFAELLHAASRPRLINISSDAGSISPRSGTRNISYAASKAALNMFSKILANGLPDVAVIALHPGWVQTDMGGAEAHLTPAESVRSMLQVIDRLQLADSGSYLRWDGQPLPY